MKKLFFVISICALFVAVPLFAQDDSGEAKGFYYVNVPIARIYPYAKGYVISYNTGILGRGLDTVYIPESWFKPGERKGEVVNITGVKIPSFTVVYKDGAFDHVKLYVRKDRSDPSWGYMPLQTNLDDKFENVTDIPFKF